MDNLDIRRDTSIPFPPTDAAQQTCDGACWRRLGDLRELPAQARPVPHAAVLAGGGQDVPRQQQPVPQHQRPEPRQLPGGGCALPQQKVRHQAKRLSQNSTVTSRLLAGFLLSSGRVTVVLLFEHFKPGTTSQMIFFYNNTLNLMGKGKAVHFIIIIF